MTEGTTKQLRTFLSCFKFADDGTMLVAHEDMLTCYILMQELCDHLTLWCIKNKLVINCEINKTEAIILNTGNKSLAGNPPKLVINGMYIRYVDSTKVLGLQIDKDLTFTEHALDKLNECNKKWGLVTRHTNRNYGLNVRSLTVLLRTTVLTKLYYAAPLWLNSNLNIFKDFWNKILMKITGAMLNPNRDIIELALHMPPLDIQLEMLNVKFLCKALASKDHITAIVAQAEYTLNKIFHKQLRSIKKFVIWKENTSTSKKLVQRSCLRNTRIIELVDSPSLQYSKDDIMLYQQKIWLDNIKNRCMLQGQSTTVLHIMGIIDKINSTGTILNRTNNIFNNNTKKKIDSHIFDYIHRNSLIFGSTRATVSRDPEEELCYFCNQQTDTPEHQLFHCDSVSDNTQTSLAHTLNSYDEMYYLQEVLVPTKKDIQHTFINRIKFLVQCHDSIKLEEDST